MKNKTINRAEKLAAKKAKRKRALERKRHAEKEERREYRNAQSHVDLDALARQMGLKD